MAESATKQAYIDNQVSIMLAAANVPINNTVLREELTKHAVVDVAGRDACVRIVRPDGTDVSLGERLAELKTDPLFRGQFPAAPSKVVAKNDMAKLRENFDAIASGKIAVE